MFAWAQTSRFWSLRTQARTHAVRYAIESLNADFELILLRSLEQTIPVSVTLKSAKVYVGYVVGVITPGDPRDMLRILPYVSGFRRPSDFKVEFTTFYTAIYKKIREAGGLSHLSAENFKLALPIADIQSISLFDIAAYVEFQTQTKPA